jgi:hypothetical protein
MAEYFVDLARRSEHAFPSREEEEQHVIYNHPAYYTGRQEIGSGFTQVYLF